MAFKNNIHAFTPSYSTLSSLSLLDWDTAYNAISFVNEMELEGIYLRKDFI